MDSLINTSAPDGAFVSDGVPGKFAAILARLKKMFNTSEAADASTTVVKTVFTPGQFVASFIELPPKVDPLEVVWHTASEALDSEQIRIIYHLADKGVYFIAAAASEFLGYPKAGTQLAAAMPGAAEHVGDGAYFVDLGTARVAVLIKDISSLRSYVGERGEAERFAEDRHFTRDQFHYPATAEAWTGYQQFENQNARRWAYRGIVAGLALSAMCLIGTLATSYATAALLTRKEAALTHVRDQENKTVAIMNREPVDGYAEYRKLVPTVMALGGKLDKFEVTGNAVTWEADFPSVITDVRSLGAGIKTRVSNERVVVSKQ